MNWQIFKETFLIDRPKYEIMNEQLNIDEMKQVANDRSLGVGIFDTGNSCGTWRDQNNTEVFARYLPTVNLFKESCINTLYLLANSKFIGFSSILVIVEDMSHLVGSLKAMQQNKYIRYKSKIILWRYVVPPFYDYNKIATIARETYMDNLIFMQWNGTFVHTQYDYADVLSNVLTKPFIPLQCVIQQLFKGSTIETTNVDLYIYSINPSLAIIINNYYFTNPHSMREGSEQDVVHLVRELKVAGIPYILLEDCNLEELLKILDYLEQKNFQPLKSFLLFLMSHGDSEDILYTHDGQVNIKTDVVKRIQANVTLRDVEKLIIVNACRGSIDAEYADDEDLEEIQPTDYKHLSENTVVLYSVPNLVQSPRSPRIGCPFIRSFCQRFRTITPSDDIRTVNEGINSDLKQMDYFYEFDNCVETLAHDVASGHRVITMPENAVKMLKLLKSIASDFPIKSINSGGTFYVCGALNIGRCQQWNFKRLYVAEELDWDAFSAVGFLLDEDI